MAKNMREQDFSNSENNLIGAKTLPAVKDEFIEGCVIPHFEPSFRGLMQLRTFLFKLSARAIRTFLEEAVETTGLKVTVKKRKRWEVKVYMIDQKTREVFAKTGHLLADLAKVSDNFVLPETEEEMGCLLAIVAKTIRTGEPVTFYTPICPDWSRDKEGRYDFKSLEGGESFIANKFFVNAPKFLKIFAKHGVPFRGIILFADWGLETEIDAKDTYGQELSPEDVQMCFASTFARTDEKLKKLQGSQLSGSLFADYKVESMQDFLTQRLDIPAVQSRLEEFFTTNKRGQRLVDVLTTASFKLNKTRLGTTEAENRKLAVRNLVEYATVGQSVGNHSILVVCESRTSSMAYNLPRPKDANVPVFFVKGKEDLTRGVNIL